MLHLPWRRGANNVANRLIKHLARSFYIDELWLDEILTIILDVLYENLYNDTRGLSITDVPLDVH